METTTEKEKTYNIEGSSVAADLSPSLAHSPFGT
jgi:hypothetical protein